MNTLEFILNRYDISKNQKSPVYLGRSRWASLTKLFRELDFKVGAEIGVERGRFSKMICQVNPQLKLYGIDAWQTYKGYRDHISQERLDEFYLETRNRMAPFNCQLIRDWSMEAVKRFEDESLDFVFIDAAHDYKHAKEDIREWSKKVRKGGIVSGHDYINGLHGITYGIKQAVNEWVKKNKIEPLFLFKKDNCPTWMYVKEKNNHKVVTRSIIYYTDNNLDEMIMKKCQEQLMKVASPNLPIVSVSIKPIEFGQNFTIDAQRGYLTVTRQIIKALEESTADIVFFAEHDVLYHPTHFDFTPAKKNVFYYNMNSWMLRAEDGHCLYYDHRSLSGMCCYRKTALSHFKKRMERIEALLKEAGDTGKVKATSGNIIPLKEGIHRLGFEPGTHNRPEKIDDLKAESWKSEFPNVDIRHDRNLTQNRFRKDQFRNARSYEGWQESEEIPFWGKGKDIIC
jgi:hypothetical protein